MKRNILVLYLVAIFLWCFSIPLPSLCLASPQPRWLQQYMAGTFHIPDVYHGFGSASFDGATPLHDERELARKRAVNDLSYNLSVVIESEFANRIVILGTFFTLMKYFGNASYVLEGTQDYAKTGEA